MCMPWAMGTLQGSKGRLLLMLTESMDSGKRSSPHPFQKGQEEAPEVVRAGAGARWGEKLGQSACVWRSRANCHQSSTSKRNQGLQKGQ